MADTNTSAQEYWLRGPIAGVPALLQPVAHALLQVNAEILKALEGFDERDLWKSPAECASVGFHLQHIPGVIDRLFSYARKEALSHTQLKYLSEEGLEDYKISLRVLLENLGSGIAAAIDYLKTIDVSTLTDIRAVGRKQIPSTLGGLLFHAAEHSTRHTGQLLVTARVVSAQ